MATYMTEYKCRRCGVLFRGGTGTSNVKVARRSAAGWSLPTDGVPIHDTDYHSCEDGGVGRADLQGFRKEG